MRGIANALILSFGKLIGAAAPFVSTMSKNSGYHILVGCSSLALLSLPLSFAIKETFVPSKDGKVNRRESSLSFGTMNTKTDFTSPNKMYSSNELDDDVN